MAYFENKTGKFKVILLLLFLLFPIIALGQTEKKGEAPPFRERLFFGGSFGLQLGTITDIELSPVVGYWVLPRVAVAAGPDYRYYSFNKNKTHIYGGKAYLELTLLRNINSVIPIGANTDIILHVENELLSLESAYFRNPPYQSERFNVNTVMVGGGLSQQIGKRAALNIILLWPIETDSYGIYNNYEFRMSFVF